MSTIKDLESIVIKSAPLLANIVGSVSPVSGIVLNLLFKVFGVDSNNLDDLVSKVSDDPEAATKLKQLEFEHQDLLVNNIVADKESARNREEEIFKITGKRDWVLGTIAFVVIFGFFTMSALLAVIKQDNTDHDILYMTMGQLTAGFLMIISYYFGSSNKSVGG